MHRRSLNGSGSSVLPRVLGEIWRMPVGNPTPPPVLRTGCKVRVRQTSATINTQHPEATGPTVPRALAGGPSGMPATAGHRPRLDQDRQCNGPNTCGAASRHARHASERCDSRYTGFVSSRMLYDLPSSVSLPDASPHTRRSLGNSTTTNRGLPHRSLAEGWAVDRTSGRLPGIPMKA